MIGAFQALSTSVALVFMDTSVAPLQAPAISDAATKEARSGASPGRSSMNVNRKALVSVVARLPTRPHSHPAVGISTTAPRPKASNARLNSPSDRESDVLKRGSCAAQ